MDVHIRRIVRSRSSPVPATHSTGPRRFDKLTAGTPFSRQFDKLTTGPSGGIITIRDPT